MVHDFGLPKEETSESWEEHAHTQGGGRNHTPDLGAVRCVAHWIHIIKIISKIKISSNKNFSICSYTD